MSPETPGDQGKINKSIISFVISLYLCLLNPVLGSQKGTARGRGLEFSIMMLPCGSVCYR